MIAIANVFVYFVRYGISDWSPTYMHDMQIMSQNQSRVAFSLFEYAGIPAPSSADGSPRASSTDAARR